MKKGKRKSKSAFDFLVGVPGKEGGAAVFGCDSPLSGRFVSVQIPGHSQILTVCEIQVFQGTT